MRPIVRSLIIVSLLSTAAVSLAQQPEIIHAQLTVQAVEHGLGAEIDSLKATATPVWVGYTIPVVDKFQSGWNSDRVAYLEDERSTGRSTETGSNSPQDHAVVLLRIFGGAITKLRVEGPDRRIDAGNLRFVWLTNVSTEDSITTIKALALANDARRLRDSAVFVIALHKSDQAVPALVALAAPGNELELREKAAFWLANQRGPEGFAALQRFARDDGDARFREKIAFDLTMSKQPAALAELIRMAHSDPSPQVRKQAQFWMATKGGKRVSGDLRSATETDPDQQVRKQAVFALSRLPGEEAATQLIQVAGTSKYPEVRKQAIFWLGQSDDPRALDYLTKLLKSEDAR